MIKYLLKTSILLLTMLLFKTFCFSQEKKYENEKYIIVLDVQQYWTDNSLSKKASEEMLKSINKVIEKTNPNKVIYVNTIPVVQTLSISFKGIKVDTITNLSKEFDKDLKIVNNNVFEKKEGDAFTVKELTNYLLQHNVKEIILLGLMAEKCVSKTAMGGRERGYDIFLIPEAIGGKSNRSKAKTFKSLCENGARIIDLINIDTYK